MGLTIDLSLTSLILYAFLYYIGRKVFEFYKIWKTQEMLEKWSNTSKDKVVLHAVSRGNDIPNISPFCLKLETYLKMAEIPYEIDTTNPIGPKQKTPWISFNGAHLSDSHLIIQYLNKKFDKNLNSHLTPNQIEITRALRIMLENNFFWGLASWRWIEDVNSIDKIMKFPKRFKIFMPLRSKRVQTVLNGQGLGRHSFSDRNEITTADLQTISVILGKKAFIGGEIACEDDCTIFAFVAQAVWAAPGSPFEKIVENDLPNLKEYCIRMKKRYWPEWNNTN